MKCKRNGVQETFPYFLFLYNLLFDIYLLLDRNSFTYYSFCRTVQYINIYNNKYKE